MNDNSGKVVILDLETRLNTPAERALNAALKHGLGSVVISGYDKDGKEYFSSSIAAGPDALWILERCKKKLLDGADEE